jgi:dienelactone hydrolase
MDRMRAVPPEPELLESVQLDGYRRDRLLIATEKGVHMPLYALVPDAAADGKPRAAIVAAHGHAGAGKLAVAGRSDIPAVRKATEFYNYDYGVRFVKEGFIVFCPDARAFGERREWVNQGDDEGLFLHSSCIALNHIAICLGRSVTGMWTFDLMRLVDYILARPDCDPRRIACAGLSGGGLQSLWLAAMDDRVCCAAVSGYFYGYKDSLLQLSDNCGCNYVPHLWEYVDMCDLGALIAPRPLLIESGDGDDLNGRRGMANVLEQVRETRRAYSLLGVPEALEHCVFHGGHKWYGSAYGFMRKVLGNMGA